MAVAAAEPAAIADATVGRGMPATATGDADAVPGGASGDAATPSEQAFIKKTVAMKTTFEYSSTRQAIFSLIKLMRVFFLRYSYALSILYHFLRKIY